MAQQILNQDQVKMTPMVFAWRANGRAATVAGPAILVCQDAVVNVGSCYNTTSGQFTVPRNGKYLVMFTGFKNNDNTGGALFIRKNASATQYRTYGNYQGIYGGMAVNAILPSVSGDVIDIYIENGLTMHTNESSQLIIIYLGA